MHKPRTPLETAPTHPLPHPPNWSLPSSLRVPNNPSSAATLPTCHSLTELSKPPHSHSPSSPSLERNHVRPSALPSTHTASSLTSARIYLNRCIPHNPLLFPFQFCRRKGKYEHDTERPKPSSPHDYTSPMTGSTGVPPRAPSRRSVLGPEHAYVVCVAPPARSQRK